MRFTRPADVRQLERLAARGGRLDIVLDTDTYNEIDDQFALAYALLSPERLNVQAVYAAPFFNDRSNAPGDGMERSYDEILRVLARLGVNSSGLVHKGSDRYLGSLDTPCRSAAALDLIDRAMAAAEPLYVVAIGAITNVASAILLEPRIVDKIVVVWLGGNAASWPDNLEFNLKQDVASASLIFDCGVPVLQVPCMPVASHLTASPQEVDHYLNGKSPIGTYLADIFRQYCRQHGCIAKEIWDIAAIAALINSDWAPMDVIHSPILSERLTWGHDPGRHFIKSVRVLNRNAIFADLYHKISSARGREENL